MPALALRDPSRVGLEDREHLLVLRDRLALEKTALHMVDLPHGMPEIVLDVHEFPGCCTTQVQIRERRLRALHKIAAALGIRLDPFRTGAAGRTHLIEQPLHRLCQMSPLAPAGHPMLTRRTARRPNQTTHRVHEEIDVRGIVHVRLHNEGVTAPSQQLARLFSRDRMAALHYQLANPCQQTWDASGTRCPPSSGTRTLHPKTPRDPETGETSCARSPVREGVRNRSLTLHHYTHHQNPPHLHPRAANHAVDAGKHVLLDKRKQTNAGLLVGIKMLETQQQRRNVVRDFRLIRMSSIRISPSSICGLRTCFMVLPCEESLESTRFRAIRPVSVMRRDSLLVNTTNYHAMSTL